MKEELIFKEECYQIMGFIFEIFNEIGYGHKEIFYQKAIANSFLRNGIEFKQQLKAKVKSKGEEIGYYIFDFLVFGKMVVEIKQKNHFSRKDISQLYAYLKAADLKLGLLVYFTKEGVRYKRIVNLD